jgi:hypothetical protein
MPRFSILPTRLGKSRLASRRMRAMAINQARWRPVERSTVVAWFETLGQIDVPQVGGKNASLGEMVRHLASRGVNVPSGFATTARRTGASSTPTACGCLW